RRHKRFSHDWSSDVCSSDLAPTIATISPRSTCRLTSRSTGTDCPPSVYVLTRLTALRAWTMASVMAQHLCRLQAGGAPAWIQCRSEERRVGKEGSRM